jgi:dihydroneopterin aldolase
MQTLTLKNMEFYAFHGCLEHEKSVGTQYIVSVSMQFDTEKAGETDDLQDTVNYQTVHNIVRAEMEKPANLIENVAWRIAKSLEKNIPMVKKWNIKLEKLNPPLSGRTESAVIEISL